MTHGAELAITPVVATTVLVALSFTPEQITAASAAMAILLGALFSGVALIITTIRNTSRKVEEVKAAVTQKVEENTAITQEIKAAVQVVEAQGNSAATAAKLENEAQRREISELRREMAEWKQTAALLAQTAAVGAEAKDTIKE